MNELSQTGDIANVSGNSVVTFIPLSRVKEPDGRFYIGDDESNTYLHLEEKYAEMLRLCDGQRTLKDVVDLYIEYNGLESGRHSVLLKLAIELVGQLFNYSFVKQVDDQCFNRCKITPQDKTSGSKILNLLFSDFLMIIYVLMFFLSIGAVINNFSLFPRPGHLFWHPRLSISVVSQFIVATLILIKHEYFHYLAAKAFGVKTNVNISHSYLNLVVKIKLSELYKLKKNKRVKIFSAGMVSDVLAIFVFLLVIIIAKQFVIELPDLLIGFFQQIILISWIGLLWQFRFYLKTDVYLIVEDVSGCDRLHELSKIESKYWVSLVLSKISKKYTDKRNILFKKLQHPDFIRIKQKLSWYVWFFIGGIAASTVHFFFYYLPITFQTIYLALEDINLAFSNNNTIFFLESFGILLIKLFYLFLFINVLLDERKSKIKEEKIETKYES